MWQFYDYPPGHPALNDTPRRPWADVFAAWPAMVSDFQRHLGVDLTTAWTTRSWAWFEPQVLGLMSIPDSLLRLTLNPPKETQ